MGSNIFKFDEEFWIPEPAWELELDTKSKDKHIWPLFLEFNQVWAIQNLVLLLIWDWSQIIVYFGTGPIRWGTGPSNMGPAMRQCV